MYLDVLDTDKTIIESAAEDVAQHMASYPQSDQTDSVDSQKGCYNCWTVGWAARKKQ